MGELTCQQKAPDATYVSDNLLVVTPPDGSNGTGGKIDSTYTNIPVKFTGCHWEVQKSVTRDDTTYDFFGCKDGTSSVEPVVGDL